MNSLIGVHLRLSAAILFFFLSVPSLLYSRFTKISITSSTPAFKNQSFGYDGPV